MARKGVKQNKYSQKFIDQLIKEREHEGKSYRYLSKKHGIPVGTIITWSYKKRHLGTTQRKQRGLKKPDIEGSYKEKYDILKSI